MVKHKKDYNSPSSLINYINNDSICYLLEKRSNKNFINLNKTSLDYIFEYGRDYEKMIIEKIYEVMKNNNETDKIILLERKEKNNIISDDNYYKETKLAIRSEKYDIILGGILFNKDNKTYGYPDLIVSGYWLNKYISNLRYTDNNNLINKVYYIIDIKSSIIDLINSGLNISHNKNLDIYKVQIYIYSKALNRIQNNKQKILNGFILGKKYTYNINSEKIIISNPFETLALIDYEHPREKINNYDNKLEEGIKYKNMINKNYNKYSLEPIKKKYLYPNMRNKYDKKLHGIKKDVAYKNKEITSLYGCGIKHRIRANKLGITNYNDKRLIPEIMGIKKHHKKYNIINKILNNYHNNSTKIIDIPKENNLNNWRQKYIYEFYVDFETFNNDNYITDKNNNLKCNTEQILYMIGVGHNLFNKWEYKCFRIRHDKEFNKTNENILLQNFVEYINSFNILNLNLENYYKNIRLYHWGNAEKSIYNKKLEQYYLYKDIYIIPWFDLLNVFRNFENPIIIKDCNGYSLKTIINKLNEYKLIDLQWTDINDGYLSSIIAKNIYIPSSPLLMAENNDKLINDLILYNEVDCKALYLLLNLIRAQ